MQCFEVIEKLGEGSFGEAGIYHVHCVCVCTAVHIELQVFKVHSRDDGQLYAVKRAREQFRGTLDR